MSNKNIIHRFKILLLLLILTISIASVSIITYFQNQNIKTETENLKFKSFQKNDQEKFENNLVGLSNTLFLMNKFHNVEEQKTYKNWLTIVNQFELLEPSGNGVKKFLAQFYKEKKYWGQKTNYGNDFAETISWDTIWSNWRANDSFAINKVPLGDPAHYSLIKNVSVNDAKRFLFKQFSDWISLINPENKKNISQLRGFLQNQQISSQIQKVFNNFEKIFENENLINFFKNEKISNIIKSINIDLILEFWKLWIDVLNPFYQKITKLKNNKIEKIEFLKKYFLKTTTAAQAAEFITLTQNPNIQIEKLFEKLHYFNGENFIDSIKDEILKITDLKNVDWLALLLKTLNEKNFKIILNLFSVSLIEYLFDFIEEKNTVFQPKEYLNDVLLDLINFFENGMFSNATKINSLLDGFVNGFEMIIKNNPKFNIILGTVKKLLSPDGKAWIYNSLEKYIKPKILNYFKWKTKIKDFLLISAKIFGNFKIQNLSHIFDNQQTIADLNSKVDDLKNQFQIISTNAGTIDLKFKKSLIDLTIKFKNLLKFLLSDKILNKKPGEEININFWIWTTIGLLYGQTKNQFWNDIGEIVKIFAQYLKDDEIVDVIIRSIDLIDIFGTIVYDFTKWKADQAGKIISDESIRNKIYELLGLKNEVIDDNTFIGQFFKIILGIKEKYGEQIKEISFSGEAFFESKVNEFWNMINPENWIYTIEKKETLIDGETNVQYTIVSENKFLIKGKKYKYKSKINIESNFKLHIDSITEQ